jgi:CSLREA domain-containing protein
VRHPHFKSSWLEALAILAALAAGARSAAATSYSIVTVADDSTGNGNCTLREAVQAAKTNAAVDACPAGSASGSDTIALAAGTYLLPLGVLDATSGEEIRIHGPAVEPPTAVISGGGAHRIFDLVVAAGRLTLEDLELREGSGLSGADPLGGAVRSRASSLTARRVRFVANVARRGGAVAWYATGAPRSLVVESCSFTSNEALNLDAADQPQAGALWANPTGDAEVRIADSEFVANRASSSLPGDFVQAGAVEIGGEGVGSRITLERLLFVDNVAEALGAGATVNGGAFAGSANAGIVRMEDLEFRGNHLGLSPDTGISAMVLSLFNQTTATIDRLRFADNSSVASTPQAYLWASSEAIVRLRDVLVEGGADGLVAAALGSATLRLDHLTVAGHSGFGLLLDQGPGSSLVLENSIVFGNGTDIDVDGGTPTVAAENLVGIDPLFTDAGAGDYTLTAGSPAADAGNTGSTFMGAYDLAHGARIVGAETDLGAFESGALFSDSFEAGTTASWSW